MVGTVMGQRSRDEWVIASELQDWTVSLVDEDSSWRHCKWLNWYQLLQIGQEKKLSGKWTLSLGHPTGRTGERVHLFLSLRTMSRTGQVIQKLFFESRDESQWLISLFLFFFGWAICCKESPFFPKIGQCHWVGTSWEFVPSVWGP